MGIYDRDYVRDEPRGINLSGDRTAVTNLILLNVALFVVDALTSSGGGHWLREHMALRADVFQTWHLWEFVTYGFAHGDILHMGFNMLALWFFGRDVEAIYGKKLFYQLYFSLIVLSGAVWLVCDLALEQGGGGVIGASGAIAGVLVVFVCHFPHRTLLLMGIIPMPAWVVAALWLGQDILSYRDVLQTSQNKANVAYTAHLGGALLGFLFYRTRWTLASLLSGSLSRMSLPKWNSGPHLRVHDPDDDDDLEERVDEILRKIHEQGADSLTKEEQRLLEAASRRAQNKRRYD